MPRLDLTTIAKGSVRLHITSNVAIFRQYGFWYDTDRVYHFVPSQDFGLIMAAKPDRQQGEPIIKGWILWRPHSLMLSWADEKRVTMTDIDLGIALSYYHGNSKLWVEVGKPLRVLAQHVVPR